MSSLRTTAAVLALTVTATGAMAGCSSEKKAPTAKDAWNKAQDTLGGYKSLEVKAEATENGKKTNATLKGKVDGDPEQITGTMDNAHVDSITIGGKSYVKGDKSYWQEAMGSSSMGEAYVSKLADQWVYTTRKSSDSTGFTNLVKKLRDDSTASNKKLLSDKATVEKDSVDGKDAWKITSEDKKVIAWVSQDDSHDILKAKGVDISSTSSTTQATYTFVSHDKDYDIKAPSGAKDIESVVKG